MKNYAKASALAVCLLMTSFANAQNNIEKCTAFIKSDVIDLANAEEVANQEMINKVLSKQLLKNGFFLAASEDNANLVVNANTLIDAQSIATIFLKEKLSGASEVLTGFDSYGLFMGPSEKAALKEAASKLPVCN